MGKIKRSFVIESSLQTRWNGAQIVKISSTHFATINELEVFVIDATSGRTVSVMQPNDDSEDPVFDVAVDPLMRFAVTSHNSRLIKFWTCTDSKWTVYKQWKFPGNSQPSLAIDPNCQKIAAMTANGGCWFYSVQTQKQLGKSAICHGKITAKAFDKQGQLWVGTQFGKTAVVNPETLKSVKIEDTSKTHAQAVTGIWDAGDYVFTAGLDEVVMAYNRDATLEKIIPVQFTIHSMTGDPKNANSCYCATVDGIKRVWLDATSHIKRIDPVVATHIEFFDRLYQCDENGVLASVDLGEGKPPHAIPLSLHSVYDTAYDEATETTAIATSSFNLISLQGENVRLLTGHTNVPTCLSAYNGLLISGAKDNTARVWNLETCELLSTLEGHQEEVSAVSFVPKTSYVVTASKDHTIKMWCPNAEEPVLRSALCTVVAHQKDINGIDVSFDGTMIATASRDKTCKLFKIDSDSITYIRTLIGHTGALWSVAFSPVDRIVATASRDQTVRVWNINDGGCIANFTEFSSSILRIRFATAGIQLIAAEGDGLFKVIRTKSGAVDFTSPVAHKESVWALSVTDDGKRVVTGAEDGTLCIWRDNTEELEEEEIKQKGEEAEAEQALRNALLNKQYAVALALALKLRKPAKLRQIVRQATEDGASSALDEYFAALDDIDDIEQWFEYVAKWATNSKWADDATAVISSFLRVKTMKFFVQNRKHLQEKIEGIIPYLERHMQRLERLHTDTYLIDHILDSTTLE